MGEISYARKAVADLDVIVQERVNKLVEYEKEKYLKVYNELREKKELLKVIIYIITRIELQIGCRFKPTRSKTEGRSKGFRFGVSEKTSR